MCELQVLKLSIQHLKVRLLPYRPVVTLSSTEMQIIIWTEDALIRGKTSQSPCSSSIKISTTTS